MDDSDISTPPATSTEFNIDTNTAPQFEQPSIQAYTAPQLAMEIGQSEQREEDLRKSMARQTAAINGWDEEDVDGLIYARYKREQVEIALMLQGRRREELEWVLGGKSGGGE